MLGAVLHRARRRLVARPRQDRAALAADGYASQFGQDRWVLRALDGLENGVFCDVGAFDGVTVSNTVVLERRFGWTGIAIEPNADAFARLAAERSCRVVHAAVSDTTGVATFARVHGHAEMLSGLDAAYPQRHRRRVERTITRYGGAIELLEVRTVRLDDVLADAGIQRLDYLSVDVEGGELAVLASAPLGELEVSVIGVENNYADPRIHAHLRRFGYRLAAVLGCDELYVPARRGAMTSRSRR